MSDLISVIVPVYNIENKLLDKCINSIINQTYKNLEIIIVDDGSKQECADECDRLVGLDPRIVLIHQANKGLSGARNAGLDIVKGDYIGFVDSDDYVEPEMYEWLLKSLLNNNCEISVCGTRLIYKDGSFKNRNNYISDMVFSKEEAYRELLIDKEMTTSSWNKLYKKELFRNIRFPEGKTFEDRYIMHELFYQCERISCLSKLLYNYYQRDNSIMNSMNLDKFSDSNLAWLKRLEFTEEVYPDLCVLVYQSLIKTSVRFLLNYNFQKNSDKSEYIQKTLEIFQLLSSDTTKEIVYNRLPKYKGDYDFLLKHKYSLFFKRVYGLKKRIFRK